MSIKHSQTPHQKRQRALSWFNGVVAGSPRNLRNSFEAFKLALSEHPEADKLHCHLDFTETQLDLTILELSKLLTEIQDLTMASAEFTRQFPTEGTLRYNRTKRKREGR